MALASKVVEAPGAIFLFSLEPILVELERGHYIGPILPIYLADLVAGRRSVGENAPRSDSDSIDGDGGRNKKPTPKVGATRGSARVWARYEAHLHSLYLKEVENLWSVLAGAVLPNLHSHVLC